MDMKSFWSKAKSWIAVQKISRNDDYQPQLDEQGLINQHQQNSKDKTKIEATTQENQVILKPTVYPVDKAESIEKLHEGFNKLINKLQDINEHLDRQVVQHEDLMNRLEQLPKLLESFPKVVENQISLTNQLLEQLKANLVKEQQFVDAVEKIPNETAKQTDALANINHQLAAAADADVQMSEGLNKFTETLEKLNDTTVGQTDGIIQMSKTFATTDRYAKYLMSRQHRNFIWVFVISISVSAATILILTAIILYLTR